MSGYGKQCSDYDSVIVTACDDSFAEWKTAANDELTPSSASFVPSGDALHDGQSSIDERPLQQQSQPQAPSASQRPSDRDPADRGDELATLDDVGQSRLKAERLRERVLRQR